MRRKHRDDEIDFEEDEAPRVRRRRRRTATRRFGFRRKLLVLAILLFALVALLPRIASLPMFRSLVLSSIASKIDGKIEIGELTLRWFAPVGLKNLRLYDAQGNLVASAASIRSERSLSSLAFNTNDLGQIDVEKPTANLVIRSGGSNLEDVLAKLFSSPSAPSSTLPKARIKLSDGNVQIAGENNISAAQLAALQGDIQTGGPEAALVITCGASLQGRGGSSGPIAIHLKTGSAERPSNFESGTLSVHAENAPIDAVALALIRTGQAAECAGQWAGDTTLTWTGSGQTATLELNDVRLDQFTLVAPQWLAADRLIVEELRASGKLEFTGSKVSAEQFKCQTEFGSVDATGGVDWQSVMTSLAGGPLPETDFQVGGNVDLARLTKLLPATLRLRPGVQIQQGNLVFQSFSRLEGGRRRFLIDGEAIDFAGSHDGQLIRWTKPIRVSATLVQDGSRAMLESLQVDTNSVSIQGQSDIQTGHIRAAGDLSQLQTELEQFFSLGETVLDGRFEGELNWNMAQVVLDKATWPITLDGTCKFESLVVALPGWERFSEPSANLVFNASGEASRGGGLRIDTGKLNFVASNDRLEANLTQPIDNPTWETTIQSHCVASGGLASWLQRLKPLLPVIDARGDGTLNVTGDAALNLSSLRVQNAQYELADFAFDGLGMQIREPKVSGQGDASLDWQAYRMRFGDITLASSSVAGRGANLDLLFDAKGLQLTGDVAYRADLNKVTKWFGLSQAADSVHWFGAAEGTARLTPVPGAVAGSIQGKIVDLAAAKWVAGSSATTNRWDVLWQEPLAELQSDLSINANWDAIQLNRLFLNSKAIAIDGRGSVADLGRSFELDLTGQWTPNWEAISAIAQGYAGRQIELRGQQRAENFRVRGPLFPADPNAQSLISRQLVAETSASWDGGHVLGMGIGPATLSANLNDAVVGFNNPQIQVGPGKVHFNPQLDLRGDPQLIFERGTLLETVELTPDICKGWMKYVAPLLAEATRAQGRFSLVSDGIQIPLSQPLAGRGSGQLVIDQATIEPGPLGQQLVQLVNVVKQMAQGNPLESLLKTGALPAVNPTERAAWLQLPPQQIAFQLDQQQIVHEKMVMNVAGVNVTTRGAIGADSSLNLVAEIPILESWIQKQPALAALKGSAIQIPIAGTLTQPRVDYRAVARLSTQMFQKAAGGQIESRLNGLLNDALQKNSPQPQPAASGVPAQPASTTTSPSIGDALQKSVEDNLLKGLDQLLGPKK